MATDLKSASFGDVLGCLETLFQASTLQLRGLGDTKGGWKCAWAGCKRADG